MKKLLTLFSLILSIVSFAQQTVSGIVRDESTGEALVGAVVVTDNGKVYASTDIDGKYKLSLNDGTYTLSVKFTGYTSEPVTVKVAGKPVNLDINCKNNTLKEVEIVADVAIDRKTPVAFSNINENRIREEGGTRDMTMMLNSTPGAYATEQGGGAGDSRVNIRGIDQRNVAVMIDGVPVNDMENGQVYWSNWDGLSDVTRTMQVQRGLGASRLAIPSVGGTINVLTRGIDQKQSFVVKSELGNNNGRKISFGYNSGEIGKGWGITMAGARRTGDGWADQTWTDAWSYFFKVQKRIGTHLISLGANGAPQIHGQRSERIPIGIYDRKFAEQLGINVDSLYANSDYTTLYQGERGLRYNSRWGYINYPDGQKGAFSERVNFYHKPQITAQHYWTINEKLYLSTILYLSVGKGGGTSFNSSVDRDTLTGLQNLTQYYNSNTSNIDALYSTTEHKSTRIQQASMNDHLWYGGLMTLTWKPNEKTGFLFGADARSYTGYHYRKVYDLLGGDYFLDFSNKNQPNGVGNLQYAMKRANDTISYYNVGIVNWGGLFAQGEYSVGNWSTFLTVTGSMTSYQRVDYFRKRDIVLPDTVISQAVGYNEVLYTNGTNYAVAQNNAVITQSGDTTFINNPSGADYTILNATGYAWNSDAARTAQTDVKYFPGFTAKTGANYNISKNYKAFLNVGYMNMAPRFNTVFDQNNREYPGVRNQHVYSAEFGAGARFTKFAANLNLYYTLWENKPPSFSPTINISGDIFTYDLIGLTTEFKGIELDFNWQPLKSLQVEGLASFGDWVNKSSGTVYLYDQNFILTDTIEYSANGIHIGDAAQTQLGGSLRWEPFKGTYFKARYTYFARNYANFDPIVLTPVYNQQGDQVGDNRDRESWKSPSYGLLDFFAGYEIRDFVSEDQKRVAKVDFTLAVFNVLNTMYISDAQNGAGFDASSALVYMGLGRRWNVGMRLSF
ncbi:MAG: TonB-dependent receptor [Bacteroidia bacterium]